MVGKRPLDFALFNTQQIISLPLFIVVTNKFFLSDYRFFLRKQWLLGEWKYLISKSCAYSLSMTLQDMVQISALLIFSCAEMLIFVFRLA